MTTEELTDFINAINNRNLETFRISCECMHGKEWRQEWSDRAAISK